MQVTNKVQRVDATFRTRDLTKKPKKAVPFNRRKETKLGQLVDVWA